MNCLSDKFWVGMGSYDEFRSSTVRRFVGHSFENGFGVYPMTKIAKVLGIECEFNRIPSPFLMV